VMTHVWVHSNHLIIPMLLLLLLLLLLFRCRDIYDTVDKDLFDGGNNNGSNSGAFLGYCSNDTIFLDNTSIDSDDGNADGNADADSINRWWFRLQRLNWCRF